MAEVAGATPARSNGAETRRPPWLGLLVIAIPALIFLWLSLKHVYQRPLWRDEAATLEFASLGWVDLARAVSHIDLVLAPYYALMHLVVLCSDGALAIRLPSVLGGLVGVVFVSMAVRERWGSLAGFVAGTFLATNSTYLGTATAARPYALTAALLAVAAWLGARRATRRTFVWWIVATCGAAVLHPLSVLAVPGLALALVRRRGLRAALLASLIPLALGGVLILLTRTQSSQVGWIKKLPFDRAFNGAERAAALDSWMPVVVVVVLAVAVQLLRRRVDLDWVSWFTVFVLPPLALWVATEIAVPLFVMRYASMFLPGLAGLIGASAGILLGLLRGRLPVRAVLAVAIACLCAWMSLGDLRHRMQTHVSVDGTEIVARYVRDHVRPGDSVVYLATRAAGGSIYGWARYEGDTALETDLLTQLAQGRGAELQVREVVSADPYRTRPSTVGGRTWLVGQSFSLGARTVPGLAQCRQLKTTRLTGGGAVVELACAPRD